MRRSRARAALVVLAAALVACGPAAPGPGGLPRDYVEVVQLDVEASEPYLAGRWDAAAKLYRRQADLARDAHLPGWRSRALYNLACVEARAGRRAEAVAAFAESVDGGLRGAEVPGDRGLREGPPVTLPHVLADPDLDTIRDEPGYREALRPYLDADEIDGVPSVRSGDGRGAVLVILEAPGTRRPDVAAPDASRPDAPEEAAAPPPDVGAPIAGVDHLQAPIAPGGAATAPKDRRWTLDDGDLRWGVARVRRHLEALARDPSADPFRVYLAGTDAETSRVAWAAALEVPERVAGMALAGVTTPRAAWVDALAAVPRRRKGLPAWTVTLGADDHAVAAALAEIGIHATRAAK